MVDDAELVAIQISKISTIIVFMILGSQARWPLANTAIGQGDRVDVINLIAALRQKCHHLAIAFFMLVD